MSAIVEDENSPPITSVSSFVSAATQSVKYYSKFVKHCRHSPRLKGKAYDISNAEPSVNECSRREADAGL